MKHILNMLNRIEAESSTNDKKVLIEEFLRNQQFVEVVKMAYDCGISYGFTDVDMSVLGTKMSMPKDITSTLKKISEKKGISDAEIKAFSAMVPDIETAEVVRRIIRRDLRCGAGPALFSSVVKQVPYQRYKSFKYLGDIDFDNYVVAQLKMDGMFSYLDKRDYTFTSRQGNVFSLGNEVSDILAESWIQDIEDNFHMGEVLVLGEKGFLPRGQNNGIINSFIQGKGDRSLIGRIRYATWGHVSLDDFNRGYSEKTYKTVLEEMEDCADSQSMVFMSASKRVRSLVEADNFYKACRVRKEEGAIIKDATNLKWKSEKSGSKYGVKLKPFAEAEFRIVEAYYGKEGKKNEFILGGIVVESEDGKIRTKVGMGFSDEARGRGVDWWNSFKGEIVTIQFCGIVTDKTVRETYCLEHSSFVETRFNEKSVANTYEECMEELENA